MTCFHMSVPFKSGLISSFELQNNAKGSPKKLHTRNPCAWSDLPTEKEILRDRKSYKKLVNITSGTTLRSVDAVNLCDQSGNTLRFEGERHLGTTFCRQGDS